MQLAENVKRTLADFPKVKVHAERDRMHLLLNGEDSQAIILKLQKVFGIQNFFSQHSGRKRRRSVKRGRTNSDE